MKLAHSKDVVKKPVNAQGAQGVEIRWLISKEDGAVNFAMRMFEVAPGGQTPLHRHPHEHEVFALEGRGTFVCDGQNHAFGPEDAIFVPGDAEHCFKNTGDKSLRFLCLIPASAV
jgi:quercetin dioxygenase-like cupin family protein